MSSVTADGARARVLVLGVGNLLLQDDGAGLELLERLRENPVPGVDYVDGGTQGLALGGVLAERDAVLVLDAVKFGVEPGTVHRIDDPLESRPPRAESAHEANAGDLLAAAALLGDLPSCAVVVGIEPEIVRTGIGLSPRVQAALPAAVAVARRALEQLTTTAAEEERCTS